VNLVFPRSHTHSCCVGASEQPILFFLHLTLVHRCQQFNRPVMFDFEKLDVYKKAKMFNSGLREFIKNTKLDSSTRDQLRRASFSIVLNLAEGSGRFTHPDRRNFYIIARSSIFECIAILDVLKDESILEESTFCGFYIQAEELSRILF